MVGVGNDQFAIVTQPIAAFDAGVRIDLPVAVRAHLGPRRRRRARAARRHRAASAVGRARVDRRDCRSDADVARRAVRYDAPVRLLPRRSRVSGAVGFLGRRIARHDASSSRRTHASASQALIAAQRAGREHRHAARRADWHQELTLAAGRGARASRCRSTGAGHRSLQIASAAGFRPVGCRPRSRDTRFLGVFVRLP